MIVSLIRYIYISFMLLATFTLILFATFPHHHHEGVTCLIMEVCDNHDPISNEHPSHHYPDDMNHRNHNCVSENDVVMSTTKENISYKVCLSDKCDHTHHFPILYLIADFLIYERLSMSRPDYGEYIVSYKSIDASQTYGLRAPPFILL